MKRYRKHPPASKALRLGEEKQAAKREEMLMLNALLMAILEASHVCGRLPASYVFFFELSGQWAAFMRENLRSVRVLIAAFVIIITLKLCSYNDALSAP